MVLAVTFIVVAVVLDGTWAMLAGRARVALGLSGPTLNRLTGGLLVTAATGARISAQALNDGWSYGQKKLSYRGRFRHG